MNESIKRREAQLMDRIARAESAAVNELRNQAADLATRVARVGTRVADASDADAAVARRQEQYELGNLEWTTVDASGTPEETLRKAQSALQHR